MNLYNYNMHFYPAQDIPPGIRFSRCQTIHSLPAVNRNSPRRLFSQRLFYAMLLLIDEKCLCVLSCCIKPQRRSDWLFTGRLRSCGSRRYAMLSCRSELLGHSAMRGVNVHGVTPCFPAAQGILYPSHRTEEIKNAVNAVIYSVGMVCASIRAFSYENQYERKGDSLCYVYRQK